VNFPGGTTNTPQLDMGINQFTLETWINLNSYSNQGILSNNHHVTGIHPNEKGYSLEIISNRLNIYLGDGSSLFKLEAQSPILSGFLPLNTWSHIAVQRSGTFTIRMFVNGNEVPVTYLFTGLGDVNTDHTETDSFYVGASNRGGSLSKLSNGKLRNLRIYERALSPAEIRQNFMNFCGNPASKQALVFWEPFNEGLYTTAFTMHPVNHPVTLLLKQTEIMRWFRLTNSSLLTNTIH